MIIKKIETFFGWGSNGARIMDFVFFRFKTLFCQSTHRIPLKLQNRCIWVSYNIPPNFKPKYW